METPPNERPEDNAASGFSRFAKGVAAFGTSVGSKFHIFLDTSKSCAVSVIDATTLTAREVAKMANGVAPKTGWLFRIDKPHAVGATTNHININPKLTGLVKDPHIPLPPGAVTASKGVAKVLQVVNKVALPVAIAIDTIAIGRSAVTDYENETTRNTSKTAVTVAGAWAGGYGGATAGASVGTMILPGIGTICGGIIGAIGGSYGVSKAASEALDIIGDKCNYDVIEKECQRCTKTFKIRKFCGEKETELCAECTDICSKPEDDPSATASEEFSSSTDETMEDIPILNITDLSSDKTQKIILNN